MTNTIRASFLALLLLAAPCVGVAQGVAQGSGGRAGSPPERPREAEPDFARFLYPPELIMQHQQAINLRPDQRTTITQAIQQMQAKVIDLQWQMQAEAQKLTELMQAETIKEVEALAQVDRVLGIEREVKRTHLGMLIRIKNALTRDQQATLETLMQDPRSRPRPGSPSPQGQAPPLDPR